MLNEEFRITKKSRTIDFTNMIDVLLILLLFLAVSSSFNQDTALSIKQTEAKSAMKNPSAPALKVIIDKDGKFYIDSKQVTIDEIKQIVIKAIAEDPSAAMVVNPDRDSKAQFMINILDMFKSAGATNLSIASKKIYD